MCRGQAARRASPRRRVGRAAGPGSTEGAAAALTTPLRAACLFGFRHPSNAPLAALHDEAKRWMREQDAAAADRASQSFDASVPAQPSAEEVERPSTHGTNPAPSDTETAVQAVPGNTENRTSADASRSDPDVTLVDVTLASQVIRSRNARES